MNIADAVKAGLEIPPQDLRLVADMAEFHAGYRPAVNNALDVAMWSHRPQLGADLRGKSGKSAVAAVARQMQTWDVHGDAHAQATGAVKAAQGEMIAWQRELDELADDAVNDHNAAVQRGDKVGAAQVVPTYRAQAVERAAAAGERVTMALGGRFNNPLAPVPGNDKKGDDKSHDRKFSGDALDDKSSDKGTPDEKSRKFTSGDAGRDGGSTNVSSDGNGVIGAAGGKYTADTSTPATPAIPPVTPSMPASPLGGSGGSSGGGLTSGLGSAGGLGLGLHQPLMSTPLSALAPGLTSPASTTPPVPRADGLAGGGLSNLGSSFEFGPAAGAAASGTPTIGGAGGTAPTAGAPQYASPLAPFASQQPAVAMPSGLGAGVPGAVTPAGPLAAGPAEAAQAPAPGGSAGGPMMAATPLAPYSTPGAGGSGSLGATVASSSPPPQPPAAPPAGGAPPLIAGTGEAVTSSGVAASTEDVDHHLERALAVLAEIVRGTADSDLRSPLYWAVAVVEVATGTYTLLASSGGDGSYVPARVFLPSTSRLAIHDPALPQGWAGDRYLGWQHPTSIIDGYYEAIRDRVYRLDVKAIGTNDTFPRRTRCGGSFRAMTNEQILLRHGQPPRSDDGQHTHRLAATDPQLAMRLKTVIEAVKPELQAHRCHSLGVAITDAVLKVAEECDDAGMRVSLPIDDQLWAAVKAGTVTSADWRRWRETSWVAECEAAKRYLPEAYHPLDLDDAPKSVSDRLWYRHYYRAGRVAELLECWDRPRERGLADIAYCGLVGGFGEQVAAALAKAEKEPDK